MSKSRNNVKVDLRKELEVLEIEQQIEQEHYASYLSRVGGVVQFKRKEQYEGPIILIFTSPVTGTEYQDEFENIKAASPTIDALKRYGATYKIVKKEEEEGELYVV